MVKRKTKMELAKVARKSLRTLTDNSPSILTAMGITGLLSTAILTGKATVKAVRTSDEHFEQYGRPDDRKQLLQTYIEINWKHYVPPLISGVTSAACIFSANTINLRRQAAALSLYTVSETALREYRDKAAEIIGEKKAAEIQEEVMKDRVTANPPSEGQLILVAGKDQLFYDSLTGQYFKSDIERIRKAQNDINAKCINEMYASQNEFYNLIGVKPVSVGESVGWNTDNPLDVVFTTMLTEEGQSCIVLDYRRQPKMDFYQLW